MKRFFRSHFSKLILEPSGYATDVVELLSTAFMRRRAVGSRMFQERLMFNNTLPYIYYNKQRKESQDGSSGAVLCGQTFVGLVTPWRIQRSSARVATNAVKVVKGALPELWHPQSRTLDRGQTREICQKKKKNKKNTEKERFLLSLFKV